MSDSSSLELDLSPDLIDETAAAPLYQQILDLLRDKIVSGQISPGDRLPPEQELTSLLGVSRITVKRALNELAVSGLVRRHRGRGTVVTFDPAAPTVKASFENLIDGLTRMGLKTRVSLIDVEDIEAGPRLSEALEVPVGTPTIRIIRARRLEGEPFSHLVTHMPRSVAAGFSREELGHESLIALLDRAGQRPVEATQSITAEAASPAVATHLEVATGAPVLCIHRIMRGANRRPVQEITATYRADRFQYQMRLTRNSATDWRGDS
jgi:GntR family transcriptional regulator